MTELTPAVMDEQFAKFESQHSNLLDEAIQAQFDLLTQVELSQSLSAEAIAELIWHEWTRLAKMDEPQLRDLAEFLA